ncbi:MAG: hypothetical protein [Cressdnaviricota sp.]|nr:MAG: hypothetical protein [Cressdnaviricota sp.]
MIIDSKKEKIKNMFGDKWTDYEYALAGPTVAGGYCATTEIPPPPLEEEGANSSTHLATQRGWLKSFHIRGEFHMSTYFTPGVDPGPAVQAYRLGVPVRSILYAVRDKPLLTPTTALPNVLANGVDFIRVETYRELYLSGKNSVVVISDTLHQPETHIFQMFAETLAPVDGSSVTNYTLGITRNAYIEADVEVLFPVEPSSEAREWRYFHSIVSPFFVFYYAGLSRLRFIDAENRHAPQPGGLHIDSYHPVKKGQKGHREDEEREPRFRNVNPTAKRRALMHY